MDVLCSYYLLLSNFCIFVLCQLLSSLSWRSRIFVTYFILQTDSTPNHSVPDLTLPILKCVDVHAHILSFRQFLYMLFLYLVLLYLETRGFSLLMFFHTPDGFYTCSVNIWSYFFSLETCGSSLLIFFHPTFASNHCIVAHGGSLFIMFLPLHTFSC